MNIKKYVFGLFFLSLIQTLVPGQKNTQGVSVTGVIYDQTDNRPLDYATIIITDTLGLEPSNFTQCNSSGEFSLKLRGVGSYKLEVFYLGFDNFQLLLGRVDQDTTLQLYLDRSSFELDEVVVNEKLPPITYAPDTVTYNAKKFYSGKEHKLGELVDKLPGLSVDEENNVSYKGKPVGPVLVEDKPFFGGNSELALTGLPADAVGKVQVLEDYNSLGFSIDPEREKTIALNILLRPEKKNIIFGDLLAGIGPSTEVRYNSRLDAFKYNKKYNLYTLGAANSINEELISFKQKLQLLGGPMSLLGDDFSEQFLGFNDMLQRPSNTNDSQASLLAFGTDFSIKKKVDVHLYGLVSGQNYRMLNSIFRSFEQLEEEAFSEHEEQQASTQSNSFVIRTNIKAPLKNQQVISANFRVNGLSAGQDAIQNYQSSFSSRYSNSLSEKGNVGLDGLLEYVNKLKKGHIHHVKASINFNDQSDFLDLRSDNIFLDRLIDWPSDQNAFLLAQDFDTRKNQWSIQNKYTHRFGPKLYLINTLSISQTNNRMSLGQNINRKFNTQNLNKEEQFGHLLLSTKPGKWKLNPSITLKRIAWQLDNQSPQVLTKLLPSFQIERSFSTIGKFNLNYTRSLSSLQDYWFRPGQYIMNFNIYEQGNTQLQPYLNNTFNLSFQRSHPITLSSWNISVSHQIAASDRVVNIIDLKGSDRSLSYEQVKAPQRSTQVMSTFNKYINRSNWRLSIISLHAQDYTFSTDDRVLTNSHTLLLRNRLKLYVGDKADVVLRNNFNRMQFVRGDTKNIIYSTRAVVKVDFKHEALQFTPELDVNLYNFTVDPLFTMLGSAKLRYQKNNSPWNYSLSSSVPLLGRTIINFGQSNLFFQESRQEVFPAYLIAELGYKF